MTELLQAFVFHEESMPEVAYQMQNSQSFWESQQNLKLLELKIHSVSDVIWNCNSQNLNQFVLFTDEEDMQEYSNTENLAKFLEKVS